MANCFPILFHRENLVVISWSCHRSLSVALTELPAVRLIYFTQGFARLCRAFTLCYYISGLHPLTLRIQFNDHQWTHNDKKWPLNAFNQCFLRYANWPGAEGKEIRAKGRGKVKLLHCYIVKYELENKTEIASVCQPPTAPCQLIPYYLAYIANPAI